jgi:hypothetical protein
MNNDKDDMSIPGPLTGVRHRPPITVSISSADMDNPDDAKMLEAILERNIHFFLDSRGDKRGVQVKSHASNEIVIDNLIRQFISEVDDKDPYCLPDYPECDSIRLTFYYDTDVCTYEFWEGERCIDSDNLESWIEDELSAMDRPIDAPNFGPLVILAILGTEPREDWMAEFKEGKVVFDNLFKSLDHQKHFFSRWDEFLEYPTDSVWSGYFGHIERDYGE